MAYEVSQNSQKTQKFVCVNLRVLRDKLKTVKRKWHFISGTQNSFINTKKLIIFEHSRQATKTIRNT